MAKVMIIDITKCNGRYNCQVACGHDPGEPEMVR